MRHQQMIKPMLIGVAVLLALGLAGVPIGDYAPWLVALVCPLMMLLMMSGMHHGDAPDRAQESADCDREDGR